jgi:hypothetical protein
MNSRLRDEYEAYAEYAQIAYAEEKRAMEALNNGIIFLDWPECVAEFARVS